jgi:hypothetical protein
LPVCLKTILEIFNSFLRIGDLVPFPGAGTIITIATKIAAKVNYMSEEKKIKYVVNEISFYY